MRIKKNKIIIIIVLIIMIVGIFTAGLWKREETLDHEKKQKTEIMLDENIKIVSIDEYEGPFVEDGSDESVENILMITLENVGEYTLQYAEAKLVFDDVTAEFAFSTLKPGETMVVLEKNRLNYPKKKELSTYQMDNVVYFNEEPNYCEDKFEISAMDGAFNIRNISKEDLSGNIAIYYKNKIDNGYLGGITYRVIIEGGMKKDEIKQVATNHFAPNKNEVMFVGYTEVE